MIKFRKKALSRARYVACTRYCRFFRPALCKKLQRYWAWWSIQKVGKVMHSAAPIESWCWFSSLNLIPYQVAFPQRTRFYCVQFSIVLCWKNIMLSNVNHNVCLAFSMFLTSRHQVEVYLKTYGWRNDFQWRNSNKTRSKDRITLKRMRMIYHYEKRYKKTTGCDTLPRKMPLDLHHPQHTLILPPWDHYYHPTFHLFTYSKQKWRPSSRPASPPPASRRSSPLSHAHSRQRILKGELFFKNTIKNDDIQKAMFHHGKTRWENFPIDSHSAFRWRTIILSGASNVLLRTEMKQGPIAAPWT